MHKECGLPTDLLIKAQLVIFTTLASKNIQLCGILKAHGAK